MASIKWVSWKPSKAQLVELHETIKRNFKSNPQLYVEDFYHRERARWAHRYETHGAMKLPYISERLRQWRFGALKVSLSIRSAKCPMGRFGGGWNWKLGIMVGGRTTILSLLVADLRFDWSPQLATYDGKRRAFFDLR